jgi:hypothetical protein
MQILKIACFKNHNLLSKIYCKMSIAQQNKVKIKETKPYQYDCRLNKTFSTKAQYDHRLAKLITNQEKQKRGC